MSSRPFLMRSTSAMRWFFSSKPCILSFRWSCNRSLDSDSSLSTVADNRALCSSFIFSRCRARFSSPAFSSNWLSTAANCSSVVVFCSSTWCGGKKKEWSQNRFQHNAQIKKYKSFFYFFFNVFYFIFIFFQKYTRYCDSQVQVHFMHGTSTYKINSSPFGQNGRHFADNIFRCIFMYEKCCILIRISLNIVPKGPIDNNPALVQIIAWCCTCNKPLSEPMLTRFINAYMHH